MRLKVMGGCVAGLLLGVSGADAAVAPASVAEAVNNSMDWTPWRIAAGVYRAQNFRFDVPTTKAIQELMVAAGVSTKLEAATTNTNVLSEK